MPTAALASAPLLEREAELGALERLIDMARRGEGRLAVVEAPPGLGKTRLLAETRARASAQGLQVLSARGGELEGEFAFGVVRQLFEPLLATATEDTRAELYSGAAALVAPLFSGRDLAAEENAAAASFAVLHGLYWLAVNLASRQPTLLVVDDLHWADTPSLRWLLHLTRRIEAVALAVVVATRPPEAAAREPELLIELVSDPAADQIRPEPLGGESVAWLARSRYGRDAEEAFVRALREATGGNPLFVCALVDTLAREHVAPIEDGVSQILTLGGEGITRPVALRMARLSTDASALLRAAATLGEGIVLRHAATLAGLAPAQLAPAADALVRADLLRRVDPVEFSHPIVRNAVYSSLSVVGRADLHRKAADALVAAGAPAQHAAAHLLLTPPGDDHSVAATLRAAARRALAEGAADVAVGYLGRALDERTDASTRAELLVELGLAERLTNGPAAAQHLEQALALAEEPAARGEIALELGRALWFTGRTVEALDVFQSALEQLDREGELDLAERLEAELVSAAWWEPQTHDVAAERLEALDVDALHGGPGSELLLANAAGWENRLARDRARSERLTRRALASGRLEAAGAAGFAYAAASLMVIGDFDDALAVYDRAVTDARRRGDVFHLAAMPLLWRGRCLALRGDLPAALADLREALDLADEHAVHVALPYTLAFLADALLDTGDTEAAQATIERAGLPEELPPTMHLVFFRLARGRLRIAAGSHERGVEELRIVGELARLVPHDNPAWVPWRRIAADGLRQLDRTDEARALCEQELQIARSWGAPHATGAALRALGLSTGGDRGIELLEEAVATLSKSPARLELARALVELGAALRRANRRTEARECLRQGVALAQRLGARALAEHGNVEIAATGARPRKQIATGLDSLTASERRVAQLAAEGKSNKEIAQALFVTVKTVELHLSNTYRKLEIASRGDLAGVLAAERSPASDAA
jgi:DNA-binding CsgD family transcriptional regulator